jgi:hypothetical protein
VNARAIQASEISARFRPENNPHVIFVRLPRKKDQSKPAGGSGVSSSTVPARHYPDGFQDDRQVEGERREKATRIIARLITLNSLPAHTGVDGIDCRSTPRASQKAWGLSG